MVRKDLDIVSEIEKECFEFPWDGREFAAAMRQRNCVGRVAEYDSQIIGYIVYVLNQDNIEILNLGVKKKLRHKGVGTQMVSQLIGKLDLQRRPKLILTVRESNVAAQCFFRDVAQPGFRVVKIESDLWVNADAGSWNKPEILEDAYHMEYKLSGWAGEQSGRLHRVNRITDYETSLTPWTLAHREK
jgi:ribosomal-protein-alanine N-acetyltransferase